MRAETGPFSTTSSIGSVAAAPAWSAILTGAPGACLLTLVSDSCTTRSTV